MAKRPQKTRFGNDAEIIVVNESMGVVDTTRRPLTGERLRRAQEYAARIKEYERLAAERAKNSGTNGLASQVRDEVKELE